jgi:hypothetical protein
MRERRGPGGSASGEAGEVRGGAAAGKRAVTDGFVQLKLRAAPAGEADAPDIAASGVEGMGGLMPYLDTLQPLFGKHDLGGVRAHTDGAAAAANHALGAEAFATGNDVAFATGSPSLHTAAHEAAHVVQQRAGVHLKGGVGAEGDVYEQHADRVADLVVQGRSAEAELSRLGPVGPTRAAVQHRLRLTGGAPEIQRVLGVMNRGLFGFTAQLDATGFVTLVRNGIQGPPTAQQQAMHDFLNQIISNAATTTVGVGAGDETLVGSYATGRIDIADIEAMAGGTGASDTGSLIHELIEQFHKQVNTTAYGGETTGAHHQGILAENAVNGRVRGPQRVVTATQNADGTIDATVEIPYTYPNGRVVTTTLTIVRNNVTASVDRETTPARSP